MVKVINTHKMIEERRRVSEEANVPYLFNGKEESIKRVVQNGMASTKDVKLSGEMIVSTDVKRDLAQKTVLEVELGREEVPLLYAPIYENITDASLPRVLDVSWAQEGAVVFLERAEGEEIKFGSLRAEEGPKAQLTSYAGGFQWTKEAEIFNEAYLIGMFNRAFGRAHNMLLNFIHFAPITTFNYKTANVTNPAYVKADGTQGTSGENNIYLSTRQTLINAIQDARKAKRPGTILLANSADQQQIEEALQAGQLVATNYRAVSGIDTIIYYDGDEEIVGKEKYTYEGVKPGEAFLVRPKRGFKELVKVPLRVEFGGGDLTRLIEDTMVGYTFRGVFAAVEQNVQKIKLPGQA